MSLESAKDRSYDVPPADERKGKAKAERDRCLGKPIITHRSTLTRYPVGTRAAPRQKNVAGMNYWRRPAAIRPMSAESRGVPRAAAGIARTWQRREAGRLGGPPWTRQTAFQSHATGACVTVAHVLGTNPRPRNQLGASGLLQPTVRSARGTLQRVGFMRARQRRPKTAVDQYLSILFHETANLQSSPGRARRPNPHQRPS
jgi:hypothetical protein